ncbi:Arc family DNA-binding protein [Halomonas sp.]|uniref:Arc family DNA-binding protein n=1 Tax=Halomonas sp. TaxID=1486246 RepID=UPI003F924CAA
MHQYKTQIRMPIELADWLRGVAIENDRSMNAQLVHFIKVQREIQQSDKDGQKRADLMPERLQMGMARKVK